MFGVMPRVDRRPDLTFQKFQIRILSDFVESNRRINVHKNVHNPEKHLIFYRRNLPLLLFGESLY